MIDTVIFGCNRFSGIHHATTATKLATAAANTSTTTATFDITNITTPTTSVISSEYLA